MTHCIVELPLVDNLLHTSTSTCAPPTVNCNGVSSVIFTNVTANSADISWSPGSMILCGM